MLTVSAVILARRIVGEVEHRQSGGGCCSRLLGNMARDTHRKPCWLQAEGPECLVMAFLRLPKNLPKPWSLIDQAVGVVV